MISIFLFCANLYAQPVATVSLADFAQNKSWSWEYRRDSGELYSTERYTVTNVANGTVTLDMSTTFPDTGNFESHHRIVVNVARCLKAYANPAQFEPWSMRMFHRNGAQWEEVQTTSTLAFEEKFNCNPYRNDSRDFKTVFKNSEAGEKSFSHGYGSENFTFHMLPNAPPIPMG